jgi:hypothetical protein
VTSGDIDVLPCGASSTPCDRHHAAIVATLDSSALARSTIAGNVSSNSEAASANRTGCLRSSAR